MTVSEFEGRERKRDRARRVGFSRGTGETGEQRGERRWREVEEAEDDEMGERGG